MRMRARVGKGVVIGNIHSLVQDNQYAFIILHHCKTNEAARQTGRRLLWDGQAEGQESWVAAQRWAGHKLHVHGLHLLLHFGHVVHSVCHTSPPSGSHLHLTSLGLLGPVLLLPTCICSLRVPLHSPSGACTDTPLPPPAGRLAIHSCGAVEVWFLILMQTPPCCV